MNVSKADKSRWWIAIFLEQLALGQVFAPGQLHLTLVPWFTTDVADEQVEKSFSQKFQNYAKFSLQLTENVMFGPHQDVAVTLVRPSSQLLELHQTSMEFFEELGGRWAVKNPYVDGEYKPHIRRRGGLETAPGQLINVNSVTLAKARRQEDNLRQVAQKVSLA